MSSRATRDITSEMPSRASRPPASTPSTVERNIRRASRTRISTLSVPAIAGAVRQPKASLPPSNPWRSIAEVSAISHFPSGGCTMNM